MISPILAGLAVGIGVPILLFYVYGVVPVSLCRSGGCGGSSSGSGSDEGVENGSVRARAAAADNASIDAASSAKGPNPSIGKLYFCF